jgi:hypothetical protein
LLRLGACHSLSSTHWREKSSARPSECTGYWARARLDLLVERAIIVEVKSIDRFAPIHTAQALTYLKLTDARQLLLMNFNAPTLKAGLKSFLRGGREVPIDAADVHELPD